MKNGSRQCRIYINFIEYIIKMLGISRSTACNNRNIDRFPNRFR